MKRAAPPAMNPRIEALEPYPFERMSALKAGLEGNRAYEHVALSIGEPKHAPPAFVVDALADATALRAELGAYPATRGSDELREVVSRWLQGRFGTTLRPRDQILPVAGTREALFSFGQAVLSGRPDSVCVMPNPFYQIYEGAALLGGARPYFVDLTAGNDYLGDFRSVPDSVWQRCELLFVCSPGNPTGRVLPREEMRWLLEQAQRHDFIIAADECYTELYPDETAPPWGFLEVAQAMGLDDYRQLVVFHSLSKRSNLPGLRSGFVAGDAAVLERYYRYRTYEGCALGAHVQRVSALAWADEQHVIANRARYRDKFERITPLLAEVLPVKQPEAGFYHWLAVGDDDLAFTRALFVDEHITVLPGSFIAREGAHGNPGRGHVRVAWVAELDHCLDAAERLARRAAVLLESPPPV